MNTFFINNDPFEDEEEEPTLEALSVQEIDELFADGESLFDWDGDALASAGFGTDEDYGGFSDEW